MKSKDLHQHKEKVKHINIQWIKDCSPFQQQGQNFRTIVGNSITSNCNSGIIFVSSFYKFEVIVISTLNSLEFTNIRPIWFNSIFEFSDILFLNFLVEYQWFFRPWITWHGSDMVYEISLIIHLEFLHL